MNQAAIDLSATLNICQEYEAKNEGGETKQSIIFFESPVEVYKDIEEVCGFGHNILTLCKNINSGKSSVHNAINYLKNHPEVTENIYKAHHLRATFQRIRLPEMVELIIAADMRYRLTEIVAGQKYAGVQILENACIGFLREVSSGELYEDYKKSLSVRESLARSRRIKAIEFGKEHLSAQKELYVSEVVLTAKKKEVCESTQSLIDRLKKEKTQLIKKLRKYKRLHPLKGYLWRIEPKRGGCSLRVIMVSKKEPAFEKILDSAVKSFFLNKNGVEVCTVDLISDLYLVHEFRGGYPYGSVKSYDPESRESFLEALGVFGYMSKYFGIVQVKSAKLFGKGVVNG